MIHLKKIRRARPRDLRQIVTIDERITGLRKSAYWSAILRRYGGRDRNRIFLVAEAGGAARAQVLGYVVGEVRDWEFGSPPCGWIFAIGVRPEMRLRRTGTLLLESICEAFRRRRVRTVRTLLARENALVLAFFRSQGMRAAPFISLERDL